MSGDSNIPLWLRDPPPKLKLDQFKLPLYPFQQSGAIFLAQNPNCLLRDSPGLGKSPQALASYNALCIKNPNIKCIIVCPSSLIYQWNDEVKKFTTMKFITYMGNPKQRKIKLNDFVRNSEIQGLILNYDILRRDIKHFMYLHQYFNYIVVYDEAQKLKNFKSKTSQAAKLLSSKSIGNKLLTATPIFNNVQDLYGLFRVINQNLFGTFLDFINNFTYYYNMKMGRYSIPIVTGTKNIELLKDKIKNYVFGREKKEVYNQLPALTFSDRLVQLPSHHMEIYTALAEEQLLMKAEFTQEVQKLAAMTHMQRCTDAVEHLNSSVMPSHPKIDECVTLIEEEFDNEKIIVYSKYTSTIDILTKELDKKSIKYFIIDGRLSNEVRNDNKKDWETYEGKAVLIISSAGGAGLNLQESGTIIFLNHPWSYGEILQIWGRIHRIGTKHQKLLIINIYVEGTIDEDIRDTLKSKEGTFNKIFLEETSLVSGADFGTEVWQKTLERASKSF